jgi:hypothetical protein
MFIAKGVNLSAIPQGVQFLSTIELRGWKESGCKKTAVMVLLTGKIVDEVTGLADVLDTYDSVAIDSERNLKRRLNLSATKLQKTLFDHLQQRLNKLKSKRASDPTPLDMLPNTLLPHVPPSISPQTGMKTPSPPTATIPSYPVIPPIVYVPPPTATIPLHPIIPPIATIRTPINPEIVQCIQTGAARIRSIALIVNILKAENENMKAEYIALPENLKKNTLLSEKEKNKDMIAAATLASDTNTPTNNKRLGIIDGQPTTVAAIDNLTPLLHQEKT